MQSSKKLVSQPPLVALGVVQEPQDVDDCRNAVSMCVDAPPTVPKLTEVDEASQSAKRQRMLLVSECGTTHSK